MSPKQFVRRLTEILDHRHLSDEQKEIQILIFVREEAHKSLRSDKK